MNDVAKRATTVPIIVHLDPDNPWLGLSSYTEETRAFFHGRDEEAAELARRVQRKLLTVLFGQSGLGKTSLLRAGLVPRLRGEGFCPVYVRIDYSADSPSPAEQIKQAIFKATAEAGDWTQVGVAVPGESLWEFLHHRGDLLRDAAGRTVLPLLIFDQFEEVFTLAQADAAGRLRASRFLEELADLVENRPPSELENRIELDEVDAGRFDFARADYRVLIALREDYLAHLESLKLVMPSITQNRMRLARMTGAQALTAVLKPGGRLVSPEVAEPIVRFVAGNSELANAEVEPSLLSLVCRELNLVRQAQGRSEISADLLAGSRETILSEFYERALADQPAGVRRVIEDELLTESGYRESLAEERVLRTLASAGATAEALATLVDRRLLRIEERLDVRRVELTHDVLCSVVKSSRDLRHEREARDAAERELAAQQAKAVETRRVLRRTRSFAFAAGALMLVALAGAIFGWINWQRALAADERTQQARADAEKLVGFLIEDFYEELEPTGRLETMGKLAHMAVGYYDGLPKELLTPQTRLYRGMALIREGGALLARGNHQHGLPRLDEAREIFTQLRREGQHTEPVTLGLALSQFTRFSAWGVNGAPGSTTADLQQAADLLRPLAHAPNGSRNTKLVYADVLNYLSHRQSKSVGVASCEEARNLLAGMGARDLSDLRAASIYADTSDSEARHSAALGRIDDAERLTREVYDIAEKVLAQRPGDLRSMANRALAADVLSRLASRRFDLRQAEEYATRAERAGEDFVRFNPSDLGAWQYWILGKERLGDAYLEQGRVSDAEAAWHRTVGLDRDPRKPSSLSPLLWPVWPKLAVLQARSGAAVEAAASLGRASKAAAANAELEAAIRGRRALWELAAGAWGARVTLLNGEATKAQDTAHAVAKKIRAVSVSADDPNLLSLRANYLRGVLASETLAALRAGDYRAAEAAARERRDLPPNISSEFDPQDEVSRSDVMRAHALAKMGRVGEARVIAVRELERYRTQRETGATGLTYSLDFSHALYVSALAEPDPTRRAGLLAEAARVLRGMPADTQRLVDVRQLLEWIATAPGRAAT
jgi:tetratricopeptide (TPR) repeat protein